MAAPSLVIVFDLDLYDEKAVASAVMTMKSSFPLEIRSGNREIRVSVPGNGDEARQVAGQLVNLALARTLEARA